MKESHCFHGVGVVGRVKGTNEKSIKHFCPEIGVEVRLTVRSPKISTDGFGRLVSSQYAFEPLSKIFRGPKTVMYVDTFLTGSDLDFLPNWSGPVIFSRDGDYETKCDRPCRGTLVGGP